MKVDMEKLAGRPLPGHTRYRMLVVAGCLASCLVLSGAGVTGYRVLSGVRVSADDPVSQKEAAPRFTVQHMADIQAPDIQPGDGDIPVYAQDGTMSHVDVTDDGLLKTVAGSMRLYQDYETDFMKTGTVEQMSFLNGMDGAQSEGYALKEIWFGQDPSSGNQSDFLVLDVPVSGDTGRPDLSKVTVTNNPTHPALSTAEGGRYVPDGDGNYTVCLADGDVVRLVFSQSQSYAYGQAELYDYDVSDGGYYLDGDYFHRGDRKATSGIGREKGSVYVDMMACGIHAPSGYTGDGARFAFGSQYIGTDLGGEARRGDPLDTVNIPNYASGVSGTGVAEGLVSGMGADGGLLFSDGLSAPALFSPQEVGGRTDYVEGEYSFLFAVSGNTHTLQGVESLDGTTGGLPVFSQTDDGYTNHAWFLDGAPSAGTDGHDPLIGASSGSMQYYRTDDRAPLPIRASDDGQPHNAFFGFRHTVDFTLSPGYCGPLSFLGISDDDMWVFLSQVDSDGNMVEGSTVQVADLGGVHDVCGRYADLWDILGKVPYGGEEQHFRLSVYWLERDGFSSDRKSVV